MSQPAHIDPTASLASLAMLSLNLKEGRDYLDYLEGFVFSALEDKGDEPFDATLISQLVFDKFNLRIPVATFAIYLKRLTKSGKLRTVSSGLQYQIVKRPDKSIEPERAKTRKAIDVVNDELAGFAHTKYGLVWDERASGAALAEFLRKYSIDFLRFVEGKSPLPSFDVSSEDFSYVIAAFVIYCSTERSDSFESIKSLVRGHILSNALMCPDFQHDVKGYRGVNFFADTRFLIKALDLESRFEAENARQLISAIRSLKGVVCIFDETKEELRGVLRAVIRGMQNGAGRGPIYRELLKRGRGVSDVLLAEAQLDDALLKLNISAHPSPRYEESLFKFQIDESEFREDLDEEVDYLSERAADHDVRVVRHIYALRKDRRPTSVEDCGFVLLTTNSALSRAAFNFERAHSKGRFFSAVVTDYHLSHLTWLKSPMQASALPVAELLASCYAAMRPPEQFWNRFVSEVDRLKNENRVSPRDHEVLRFSAAAPDELMEVTRGQVEGITAANIHIILEKLEKGFAAERRQELEREHASHQATRKKLQDVEAEKTDLESGVRGRPNSNRSWKWKS